MKYPIAKSDRQPIPLTPKQKLERRRKRYRKNRRKILRWNKVHRWEKAHLPPEQWTRRNEPQRVELCSQCHLHKNIRQFALSFSRICIMCRHPNMPPIDGNRLTLPERI